MTKRLFIAGVCLALLVGCVVAGCSSRKDPDCCGVRPPVERKMLLGARTERADMSKPGSVMVGEVTLFWQNV